MECPVCGHEMNLEEKDTSSGRDMRTYRCGYCGRLEDVDYGIALWQVLSDAREAEESRSRSQGDETYGEDRRAKAHRLPRFIHALWQKMRHRAQ
jgi:hypothetical protein